MHRSEDLGRTRTSWQTKRAGQAGQFEAGALVIPHVLGLDCEPVADLEARRAELDAEKITLQSQMDLISRQIDGRIKVQSHKVDASASEVRATASQVRLKRSELKRLRPLARRKIASPQALEKAEIVLPGVLRIRPRGSSRAAQPTA